MSESGWALRCIAADLNAVASVLDELDASRWALRRRAADSGSDDAARLRGYLECADELLDALDKALRGPS